MPNATIETSKSEERLLDNMDRIVDESSQLDSIRKLIDEKGLDPIWLHLIRRFGSIMYLEGLRAPQSSRTQSSRSPTTSSRWVGRDGRI